MYLYTLLGAPIRGVVKLVFVSASDLLILKNKRDAAHELPRRGPDVCGPDAGTSMVTQPHLYRGGPRISEMEVNSVPQSLATDWIP